MKYLANYTDEYGTIYHLDDNGLREYGDGMARFCSKYLCEYILEPTLIGRVLIKNNFQKIAKDFFLTSGEPIRSPVGFPSAWWSKPGTASGDQIEPLLCCYLVMGMMNEFWSLIFKILKRGGFAWNTRRIGQQDDSKKIPDFILIRIFGLLLRGLCTIPLFGYLFYPIVTLWDLATLPLTTLARCIVPLFDRDNTGDDLNYFHKLIAYYMVAANIVSYMCRNFYYAFRPLSGDVSYRIQHKGTLGCISAFDNYYAGPKNPPLNVLLNQVALRL